MAMNRRTFLKTGARVAGGLVVAACVPQAPAATTAPTGTGAAAVKRGTIKWGVSQEVVNFEPLGRTGPANLTVYRSLYDGLTGRDTSYKLVPKLAESWTLLNDTTWQFKLRSGVKFHNGDAFTAEDVKYSIEASRDPATKTIFATSFATVARIDIIDPLTVNIVTKAPDGVLPDKLSMYPGYVIPQKYIQSVGYTEFAKKPVGTGPYAFKEALPGVSLTLVANESYWGPKPNADSVIVYPRPELAARVAALKTGELNLIDNVSFDQYDDLAAHANTQVVRQTTAALTSFFVNATVKPLDNKLVRQALSLAIDRPGLNKSLYRGLQTIANGPLLAIEFSHDPSLPPYPYDPNRAKALLQQAGYAGERILLEFTTSGANELEQAIAEQWKAVGINAVLGPLDAATRDTKLAQKTFQGIFSGSFVSLYGDPDSALWRTMQPGGSLRYWTNAEFDRLGAEAAATTDQAVRRRNFQRMSLIMIDEQPWLSLWDTPVLWAAARNVSFTPGFPYTGELDRDRIGFK
jgi:peptide/nickel transport system substrate-binding protein